MQDDTNGLQRDLDNLERYCILNKLDLEPIQHNYKVKDTAL